MGNNPEYFFEIVFLRAMAILGVINIHVSNLIINEMSDINFLTFLYYSINVFSGFAVPLFVAVSGFVLFNKYKGSFSLRIFYKKRFLSIVPQYIFITIFAFLFLYIGKISFDKTWNFTVIDIIYHFLTGDTYYHLWFVVLIIQLYILYPVIEKVFTKSVENHRISGLLFFLFIVQIVYWIFSIQETFLIGRMTIFLGYLFYFVLGMYGRYNYLECKKRVMTLKYPYLIFLGLLSATILGIFWSYLIPDLNQIFNVIHIVEDLLYFILIFILCLYIALKISRWVPNLTSRGLHIIGSFSFGIYLIEPFILAGVTILILPQLGINANNWLIYPLVYLLVLSLCVIFVYVMNKIPYHEYIIGSSR